MNKINKAPPTIIKCLGLYYIEIENNFGVNENKIALILPVA